MTTDNFNYQLEFRDLLGLSLYIFMHRSQQLAALLLLMVLGPIVILLRPPWMHAAPPLFTLEWFANAGVPAMGAFLFLPVLVITSLWRATRTQNFKFTSKLTVDGLETSTAAESTFRRWEAFYEAAVTRQHLFLFVSRTVAVVVPRRAFPRDPEWRLFVTACQEGIARAKAVASAGKSPA